MHASSRAARQYQRSAGCIEPPLMDSCTHHPICYFRRWDEDQPSIVARESHIHWLVLDSLPLPVFCLRDDRCAKSRGCTNRLAATRRHGSISRSQRWRHALLDQDRCQSYKRRPCARWLPRSMDRRWARNERMDRWEHRIWRNTWPSDRCPGRRQCRAGGSVPCGADASDRISSGALGTAKLQRTDIPNKPVGRSRPCLPRDGAFAAQADARACSPQRQATATTQEEVS
jgi:hypothetical protein